MSGSTKKVVRVAYRTDHGVAYQGDSALLMDSAAMPAGSVDLIFTSPPYALTRKKDYGNKSAGDYVKWFMRFVPGFQRVLAPNGSLVVDIGGAYLPGGRRSVYHFELAVELAKHFDLCQEFYWYNPAKLPSPAEWTNVRRVRVKDSVNLVLWFAKDAANTSADNARVLRRYSDSMRSLLRNGYQARTRPSDHEIGRTFSKDNSGAISPNLLGFALGDGDLALQGEPFEYMYQNLLSIANTGSSDRYLTECRRHHLKPHTARFPKGLPGFFIEFLTRPKQTVFDPFAGSNTTGEVAEMLGRKWRSCDLDNEGRYAGTYVRTSAFRFPLARLAKGFEPVPPPNWKPRVEAVPPARNAHKLSSRGSGA